MGGFRLLRIAHSKQFIRRALFITAAATTTNGVPKGHLAIYVGETEKKRFVIPISYLNHPSFKSLLSQVEEEFGFNHPMGCLTIPCREETFLHLTCALNCS